MDLADEQLARLLSAPITLECSPRVLAIAVVSPAACD
jgi:hypothetical protein